MTEEQWLTSVDPEPMRTFLRNKSQERKMRLWACSCCRRIWHLVTEHRCHHALEVAERYADGLATIAELDQAHRDAVLVSNEDDDRWAQAIVADGGDLGPGYTPHEGLND